MPRIIAACKLTSSYQADGFLPTTQIQRDCIARPQISRPLTCRGEVDRCSFVELLRRVEFIVEGHVEAVTRFQSDIKQRYPIIAAIL